MENKILKSDNHYRAIEESSQTEPIVIMEELIERLIKGGVSPVESLNLAMAQKHMTRASVKDGEGWKKEIQKAINYQTRAITGEWAK